MRHDGCTYICSHEIALIFNIKNILNLMQKHARNETKHFKEFHLPPLDRTKNSVYISEKDLL